MNFKTSRMLFVMTGLLATTNLFGQDDDSSQSPMSLSGLSVSQAYQVEDGQPLDLENEVLLRLLHRVAKVSQKNFDKFSDYTKDVTMPDVLEDPRKFRFWVFRLKGRVKGVRFHKFADADPGSSLKGCYVVELEYPDGQFMTVVARAVPQAWIEHSPVDQIAIFTGFYFGTVAAVSTNQNDEASRPLFLANRIAWRPNVNEDMGVGASQVLLAMHGVDIGLLDEVKKQNTLPLSAADTEFFFQMLGAARLIKSKQLPAASADFVELMQNPTKHFADSVKVQGRVRRCVAIEIDDKDIAARLGFDRYYELDMFIPLDDQRIVVRNGPKKTLEYRHRFPVTVCMVELGQGTTIDDVENHFVEVDGFFYRFWKYKSEFTDQEGGGGQVSPLIIGVSPMVISEPGLGLDRLLTICILGLLLGAVAFLWFMRAGNHPPPPKSKLNQPLPDQVDFSGIGQETDRGA